MVSKLFPKEPLKSLFRASQALTSSDVKLNSGYLYPEFTVASSSLAQRKSQGFVLCRCLIFKVRCVLCSLASALVVYHIRLRLSSTFFTFFGTFFRRPFSRLIGVFRPFTRATGPLSAARSLKCSHILPQVSANVKHFFRFFSFFFSRFSGILYMVFFRLLSYYFQDIVMSFLH